MIIELDRKCEKDFNYFSVSPENEIINRYFKFPSQLKTDQNAMFLCGVNCEKGGAKSSYN